MKVKLFAATELEFESLLAAKKSTKIAVDKEKKIEYWFDPKTSTIYGYMNGKTTQPVAEFAIKDDSYFENVLSFLRSNKSVKFVL